MYGLMFFHHCVFKCFVLHLNLLGNHRQVLGREVWYVTPSQL